MRGSKRPMVSCVCVTRQRVSYLRRAIDSFLKQTYPNKELVILFESEDIKTREYLGTIEEPSIRSHEIPSVPKRSLGYLRNLSVELAVGEYYCQWDDDDWYHQERIGMQMDCLLHQHKDACFLTYWLMYDAIGKQAYLSPERPWPGSIFCRRRVLSGLIKFPDLDQHEDGHVMREIFKMNTGIPLVMPSLYIKVYHGRNTLESEYFQGIFEKSQALSTQISELFTRIVEGKIAYVDSCRKLFDKSILRELDYFSFYHGNDGDGDYNLPDKCGYIDRLPTQVDYNAVLKSQRDIREYRSALQMLGLPVHIDSPKNWDSYAALEIILRHSGDRRSEKLVLDAGGEDYSAILPQLAACGFENLTCINLAIKTTEVRDKICYEFGDITGTRFADGMFDFIVCLSVVEHGVDLERYFKEMGRILKKGGLLITSTDYWVTPIDTENRIAYGVPVRVFDRSGIVDMVNLASRAGMALKGRLDLECGEKTVTWLGMEYTFIYFTFERSSLVPDSETVCRTL